MIPFACTDFVLQLGCTAAMSFMICFVCELPD
jgi:hypothetical protein